MTPKQKQIAIRLSEKIKKCSGYASRLGVELKEKKNVSEGDEKK